MPTSATTTWTNAKIYDLYPNQPAPRIVVQIAGDSTLDQGTVLGELSDAPGVYAAYATGNSDGTEVAKAILEYACQTDSDGNITLGAGTTGGQFGQFAQGVPVFIGGAFLLSDLTGLDSGAITDLGGHLASGDLSDNAATAVFIF